MSLYPVVILAGGTATRLRPITEKIPKALVSIANQPFIYYQLRLLQSWGVRKVVLCVWYRGELIRDFVGDGGQFGLEVECAFDGETPLGTAGAIRRALHLLESPFFVLYGDSYLPCDYLAVQAFFDAHDRLGLMTVFRNAGRWDPSNVQLEDSEIVRYDKRNRTPDMKHIDYGLGIFRHDAFAHLRDGEPADLSEVYQRLLREHQLLAYEVAQRFYEVGSHQGLQELDQVLTAAPDKFLHKDPT
jgi:NDP-sugar pyrophosphorylase family protein